MRMMMRNLDRIEDDEAHTIRDRAMELRREFEIVPDGG